MSTSFGETKRDKKLDELYTHEDAVISAISKLESKESLTRMEKVELSILEAALKDVRKEMQETMEVQDDSDDYYEALQDDKSNLN